MIIVLLLNILIIGSGYGLTAMAFRLMASVSPFFNMALASFIAFGSYSVYAMTALFSISPYVAIPIGIAFCAVCAAILERAAFTPLREHGASPMVLLVVSLGFYTIFESVLHLLFGPQYQILGSISAENLKFETFSLTQVQAITIACNFAVFIFLNYLLSHTFFGKTVRAVNNSSKLANIIGLNNNKIILLVSGLTGAVLGLSGVLTGYDTGMEPTMGFNLLFKGIIAAIIGGMNSMSGPFLGAFFLAGAENIGVMILSSEWRDLVAFIIFIIFLVFRPQGIFQKKEHK